MAEQYDSHMAMEGLIKSSSTSHNNVHSGASAGGGDGLFGKMGGSIQMMGESQGIGVPGAGPGMDGFFASVNANAFLNGEVVKAMEGVVSHQAGGELKISDAGLNNTGQGLAGAMPLKAPVTINAPGMIGGGGGGQEH